MANENLLGEKGGLELSHYHWHDVAEIVMPDGYEFWYQTDKTIRLKSPVDPRYLNRVDQEQPLDPPECVHWRIEDAPANERGLFFLNGSFCQKIFKGNAPTWWRMWTNVSGLKPGLRYNFRCPVFPDLVAGYNSNGQKVWAPDPLSGELMLEVRSNGRTIATTEWLTGETIKFGVYNFLALGFTADADNADVVLEFRGRWGLQNNGIFTDDWGVFEVSGEPLPPPSGVDWQALALGMLADNESLARKWQDKIGVAG